MYVVVSFEAVAMTEFGVVAGGRLPFLFGDQVEELI
jgi:hypothetical protein